jgi:TonB family protein
MDVAEFTRSLKPEPIRTARLLRLVGTLLMLGALVFPIMMPATRHSLAHFFASFLGPTQKPIAESNELSAPATPLIEQARQIIPQNLREIYRALNEGNPAAARGLITDQLLSNSNFLDRICRPYAYRAHYVEAVLERPNGVFEARVHTLFQPVEEQADALFFANINGQFVLQGMDSQPEYWLGVDKRQALDMARQFIYAAKANKRDIVNRLASKDLDLSPLFTEGDYASRLSQVGSVSEQEMGVAFEQHQGLKVSVHLMTTRTDGWCGDLWHFLVDPMGASYKIVEWEFHPIVGCYRLFQPVRRDKFDDPNLEEYTLRRFGIAPAENAKSQSRPETSQTPETVETKTTNADPNIPVFKRRLGRVELPESVMRPLLLEGDQPAYPPLAAEAGISGTVVLRANISTSGTVEDVHVVSGHPMLASAAMDAVKRWRYNPYVENGQAIAVETEITVPFTQKFESVHK